MEIENASVIELLDNNDRRLIFRNMDRRIALGILAGGVFGAPVIAKTGNVSISHPDANKRIVGALIERVWRQGRLDDLSEFWTSDCVNHADDSADRIGLSALRKYHAAFATWFADVDDIVIDIQQQVAERGRVVTQMLLRARHRAKQRDIALATIRIDRIIGGKIAEHWSIADNAGLFCQLA